MTYKVFFKDLAIKTVKTFFQALAGAMTSATLIEEIDWKVALSASLFAALYCVIMNIGANLPSPNTAGKNGNNEEDI